MIWPLLLHLSAALFNITQITQITKRVPFNCRTSVMGEVIAFYCPRTINMLFNSNDFIDGTANNFAVNTSYLYATKS